MIRNIIFDFGGVIAPIDRDRAVQAFIRLGLKDADSRLDKYHQTGIFQQLEEGTLTEQEFREILLKHWTQFFHPKRLKRWISVC